MRLRTVSPNQPGWTRRRAGKGFTYADEHGDRLNGEDVERIRALVIPPAWKEVWICPFPNGHIQAVGVDDAGRRQYLYHPVWREQRDAAKFDRILQMAKKLPKARAVVAAHLIGEEGATTVTRERVMACAVRLMDVGFFRIGSDEYAEEHGSYGLTTWHATVIAATVLAESPTGETKTARRKVIREAVVEVSEYLGNTPAIARNSYVDPRVLDLYEDGTTIAAALRKAPRNPQRRQEHIERAVLRMLSRAPTAPDRAARQRRAS